MNLKGRIITTVGTRKQKIRYILEQEVTESIVKYGLETDESKKLELLEEIQNLTDLLESFKYDGVFTKFDINKALMVGAGLVVAGAILRYEDSEIINTKSFGIMSKLIGF